MTPPADQSDLELRWRALTAPTGDRLTAERVRDWAGGRVLVALDADGTRHLLVQIPDDQPLQLPRPVAGLGITARRLRPAGQPDATWIDLAGIDPQGKQPFSGLCADIITELPTTGPPDPATLLTVLERWRRFWTIRRDGLNREEQLGLVGELWLLLEWLPRLTPRAISNWQGPLRGRHDFVSDTLSVEVKTTAASTGPVVHRITRLDQLEKPGQGQLYLLSLRAVADPLGAHSLDTLTRRARRAATAAGAICAALLDDRLRAAGITATDDGHYNDPLSVTQQELYRVGNEFPRLTSTSFPSGLPAGVVDVTYSLDTSACGPWLISNHPQSSLLEAIA